MIKWTPRTEKHLALTEIEKMNLESFDDNEVAVL